MASTVNIFVTKLPRDVCDTDLMSVFCEYNPVSAKVMLDAATGKSKGFGFVLFPTAEAGQEALDALNGTVVTVNRRSFHLVMQPSKHDGRISCAESNALYVRNIPMTVSRDDIQKFLSQCGTLSYSVMRPDNYGSPVWVVYAEYDCTDCAKQSLRMFHGNTTYFSSPLPILAKFADSNEVKEDRRKRRDFCGPPGSETRSGQQHHPAEACASSRDEEQGTSPSINAAQTAGGGRGVPKVWIPLVTPDATPRRSQCSGRVEHSTQPAQNGRLVNSMQPLPTVFPEMQWSMMPSASMMPWSVPMGSPPFFFNPMSVTGIPPPAPSFSAWM